MYSLGLVTQLESPSSTQVSNRRLCQAFTLLSCVPLLLELVGYGTRLLRPLLLLSLCSSRGELDFFADISKFQFFLVKGFENLMLILLFFLS